MTSHPEIEIVEVTTGIWAAITSIISPEGGGPNAGFVLCGDHVLVIDTLISPSYGRLLAKHLHEVTGKSAIYLINTHNHGDHVFGNQAFSPPAIVIAHEKVREALLLQGKAMVKSYVGRFSSLIPDIKDTTVITPNITYKDCMTLHFDDRIIELIHPGVAHTHGDTIVYLPKEKILFAGDILFNHIFPTIKGSSGGWIAAIEQIEAMEIETIIPGHGLIAGKTELVHFKQCLIELRSQVMDCFSRGFSAEQTVREIDIPYMQWPHAERLGPDVEIIYEELMKEG